MYYTKAPVVLLEKWNFLRALQKDSGYARCNIVMSWLQILSLNTKVSSKSKLHLQYVRVINIKIVFSISILIYNM